MKAAFASDEGAVFEGSKGDGEGRARRGGTIPKRQQKKEAGLIARGLEKDGASWKSLESALTGDSRFTAKTVDSTSLLSQKTVGLATKEDFVKAKLELEGREEREKEEKKKAEAKERRKSDKLEAKRKKRKRQQTQALTSFSMDDDEEQAQKQPLKGAAGGTAAAEEEEAGSAVKPAEAGSADAAANGEAAAKLKQRLLSSKSGE